MQVLIIKILALGIFAMAFGALWYGPLFGKLWLKIIGVSDFDESQKEATQKGAKSLYLVSFVLALFQITILSLFIGERGALEALGIGLVIWAGFIMPTIASGSMWNNDRASIAWSRFLVQSGYQVILFAVFSITLSLW